MRCLFLGIDNNFDLKLIRYGGHHIIEIKERITNMKKLIVALIAFCMLLNVPIFNASANGTLSWYCKRAKNHEQPSLPSEFSFIKDYDGMWIDTSGEKTVYLTFDAGYENGNVEKILDVLKEKQVPSAFFILINLIETSPELVKRMGSEGHTVCNHTAHHKDMTKITDINDFENELEILNAAYKDLTGDQMPKYYRPPEGKFTKSNLEFAKELDYKTVFWSFAYADWDNGHQPSESYAKKKILDNIHNGAVILLHPTSATNAAILGEIIDEVRLQGYEFGTLDELYEKNNQS